MSKKLDALGDRLKAYEKMETEAKFLREKLDGKEPNYGDLAAATFEQYLSQVE